MKIYVLKEDKSWSDVENAIMYDCYGWKSLDDIENYFDKIILDDVILEEQKPKNNDIDFEIIKINDEYYKIIKSDENGKIVAEVMIGNNELIKNIKDFNIKCSLLFGFILEESKI